MLPNPFARKPQPLTLEQAILRTDALRDVLASHAAEIRALQTRVSELESLLDAATAPPAAAAPAAAPISTVGPIPATPADITSPRAAYRYIAVHSRGNEDAVRKLLTSGAAFKPLRDTAAKAGLSFPSRETLPVLRWLAGTPPHNADMRYTHLASGMSLGRLREMDAQERQVRAV